VLNTSKKKRKEKKEKRLIAKENLNSHITSEWYYVVKCIAILVMLIESIAKVIGQDRWGDEVVYTMRVIGRIAFPLFAWELVECFHFTKHKWKHSFRIGLIAIISEIPFDKTSSGLWYDTSIQNICFTFFIGWIMLMFLNADWKKFYNKIGVGSNTKFKQLIIKMSAIGACLPLLFLPYEFNVEYLWRGIGLIFLFEFAKRNYHRKFWECIAIICFIGSMGIQGTKIYSACYFCLVLMYLAEWNSKKQMKNDEKVPNKFLVNKFSKTVCRWFYPAHLIILAVIAEVIK